MKKTLLIALIAVIATGCYAQNANYRKVSVSDSIWINGKWVKKVNTDESLSGAGDNEIPSTKAIKSYVDNAVISAGSGVVTSKGFASVSALRASTFHTVPGDLKADILDGGRSFKWNPSSTVDDDGGVTVVKATAKDTGRWERIFRGPVRADEVSIKTDGTNQTTALNTLASNTSIKEIVLDAGDVTITGTFDAQGKKLVFRNGAKIVGTGTVKNAFVEADYQKQVFDTALTTIALLNYERSGIWFGMVGNNSTDNFKAITNALASCPQDTSSIVTIPQGDYRIRSTVNINKPVHLRGTIGTYLFFPASTLGIHIYGNLYRSYLPTVEKIAVYATGKSTTDGWTGGTYPTGDVDEDASHFQYHGILIETIAQLSDVLVGSFSGHGIRIYGSVGEGKNASHTMITGGKVESCRGAGIYISGPDANACTVTNMDIRDNNLCGLFDESFLANSITENQFHNNGYYHFSHYRQTDVNGAPVVTNNYFEGQPIPNYMASPKGFAVDQTNGAGWRGNGSFYQNGFWNRMTVQSIVGGSNVKIGFNSDTTGNVFMEASNHNGGNTVQMRSADDSSQLYFHYRFNNAYDYIEQWGGIGSVFTENNTGNKRYIRFPSFGYGSGLMIGDNYWQTAPSKALNNLLPFSYKIGDRVTNGAFTGSNVPYWTFVQSGVTNGSGVATYSGSDSAKSDGSNTIILKNKSTTLKPGDGVVWKGKNVTITTEQAYSGTFWYYHTDVSIPSDASYTPVTAYSTPVLRATGYSVGPFASKPSLDADDIAYRYYASDTLAWYTWTGADWIKDGGTSGGGGGSGSGTVNSGTQYRLAYYAATGAAVSNTNSGITTDGDNFTNHISVLRNGASSFMKSADNSNAYYWLGTAGLTQYFGIEADFTNDKGSFMGYDQTAGAAVKRLTFDKNFHAGMYTSSPNYGFDLNEQKIMIRGKSNIAEMLLYDLGSGAAYGSLGVDLATDELFFKTYVAGSRQTVLKFSNDGTATMPFYNGTGNRIAYYNSAGKFVRGTIDPANIVQKGDSGTLYATPTDLAEISNASITNLGNLDSLAVPVSSTELGIKSIGVVSNDGSIAVTKTVTDSTIKYDLSAPTATTGNLVIVDDANYTVASGVTHVIVKNQTTTRTITLPAASSSTNRIITIRNASGSTLNISSIRTNVSTTTASMSTGIWFSVMSDGTEWWLVAQY